MSLGSLPVSSAVGAEDGARGRWEFEDRGSGSDRWRPYSSADCKRLDEAERSKQSTCELSFPYIVDMSSKKQINRNTGRERSVRRRPSADNGAARAAMLLGFAPQPHQLLLHDQQ